MSLPRTQGSEEEGLGRRLQGVQGGPFTPIDHLPSAPACDPTRPLTPSTWPRSLLPGEWRTQKLCAARSPTLPSFSPRTVCQPPRSLLPPPAEDQYRSGLTLAWAFHTSPLSCPSCAFLPPSSVHTQSHRHRPQSKPLPGTHHPPRAWLACVLPETAPAGSLPGCWPFQRDPVP